MDDTDIKRAHEIADEIERGFDGDHDAEDAAVLRRVADRAAKADADLRTYVTREPAARPHGESRSE